MKQIASLIAVLLVFSTIAFSQGRKITGQVRDETGRPVPFATVTETNTRNAVTADVNGNYSITISGNQITITAAGFQPQTLTVTGDVSNVTLTSSGQMQEVVVTALGIRRTRNTVPYAAQQIQGDEVSKNRGSNFVTNLSGKVSGVEIRQTNTLGGSTNAVIRGFKSVTGDNQALFVVDGVPFNNGNTTGLNTNTAGQRTGRGGYDYGNAAADINPDDIESITVLKGAAASALYGSQGANGVILITTKKGSRGLGITLNSGIGIGSIDKSTFIKYQQEYGGGYGRYYEDPNEGYFLYRDPGADYAYTGSGSSVLIVPTSEDASYGAPFDPNQTVFQWDAFDPTSPYFGKGKPWVPAANGPESFFKKAFTSNHSVFIDGGNEKGTFKLGYTRTDDHGILPNSRVDKNLVNFGGTLNITERFLAGASVNFSNINGKGRYGTGYDDKNMMTNFRQWWPVNVDLQDQKDAYFRNRDNVTWNWADPTDLVPIYWDNVYFSRYENYETDHRNRYFGNTSLSYKITNWLNVLGRISLDSYDELQEERQAVGSVTTSNYTRFNRTYRETNYDLLLNLDRDLTKDLNLKALVGGNIRRQHTESIRASTNGGLIVPRVYALSNSLNTPNAPVEFDGIRQVDGVFAGATFAWRDMLVLDGTIRRDVSSTLPKDNNVYYYPSVSFSYLFSKSLGASTSNWLSYGKFRANYAEVGNDAPVYSVYDVYAVIPPFGGNPQSSVTGTKNNPDLLPERTKSGEVGLEMAFLKNRVGFDVSYYSARSFDQILPVIVSTATGYTSKFLNAATVDNKGVEVSIFATPVKKGDFSWDLNLNWSRNRNKVVKLFEGSENVVLANFQGGITLNATLGKPYGTIRGTDFIYTDGQRTVGANGRYLFSPTANQVIGDPNPDWIGGLNNTLKYKSLSLSFLIDMKKGGDIFSLDTYYGMGSGMYPETAGLNDLGNPSRLPISEGGGVILPGVKQDGKPNDIRVSNTNYGTFGGYGPRGIPAKNFVYDAGYVKLREAILSYSIPKETVSRLKPFKGIDVSLIGRNLWIIDKNLPYADPEEIISAGNFQGYQGGAYPTVRTFAVNLKLRF